VVTLTPAKLSCTFHKMAKLVNGAAPSPATASTQTLEVASGTPAVNLL
jgi:alkaline phosphatase D